MCLVCVPKCRACVHLCLVVSRRMVLCIYVVLLTDSSASASDWLTVHTGDVTGYLM
jgi:hypothetical protein